ncbi:hypothetical protein SHI21_12300 [Bacteriovorax sp. PP10]|uniref:SSD domain-containing protein n=1 Tax=Bacteriovorax antarcticus TaxID=3088717 RepID=A0ABU5VVM7_9BACT|nr:hypothetical protein [Bacteriovorax sp. PP10]MEA9356997.1 hypothetical protein [Bacteriovorax sp. PP10]
MVKNTPTEAKVGEKSNYLLGLFQGILRYCYVYPKTVILIFLGLFILAVSGLRHIHLELDIYDVKNESFASSSNWFKLRNEFKDPNSLYFVWKPSRVLDSQIHCQWQREIQNVRNKEESITRAFQVYSLRSPIDDSGDLLYKKLLEDPCAENLQSASLNSVQKSYLGPVLLDPNHTTFLTEVSFESANNDGVVPINEIERISNDLLLKNKTIDPKGDVQLLGPLSYRIEFKKILTKDLYINVGLLIFIAIFFRLFLGTWVSGVVYVAITCTTIFYTLGLMGIMGYPVDILTNNLILMTAIAGTADFLFLSFEFFKYDPKKSYHNIITPAFFTTFTTMVGFISLYSSDLEMIRRFGVAAATGAFFEWALLFNLVPAIMGVLKIEKSWVNREKAFDIEHFKKFLKYTPSKKVIYSFLFVSVMAFVAWPFLNYSDSPKNNFPQSHPLRVAIEDFQKKFNWEGNISLLFKKDVSENEMKDINEKVKKHKLVLFIENKKDLLDSWTNNFESKLRKDLIIRDFEGTPLNNRFESPEFKRSVVYLKNINTKELEEFQDFTKKICGDKCIPTGQVLVYLELNKRVSHTMLESFVTSIFLVLIILFTLMHTLKIKGASFKDVAIASLVAPLFMVTVIAVLQVPVNVVTSIFFAALVGLTGDNAIQYLFASNGGTLEKGLALRGDASLVFSLLLIFGSLFFIGQTLIPLKWLGVLFSLGFLVTFIGDYWILKGLNEK